VKNGRKQVSGHEARNGWDFFEIGCHLMRDLAGEGREF
jgi:hypothetical protein